MVVVVPCPVVVVVVPAGVVDLIASARVPFGIVYSSDAIARSQSILALPPDEGQAEFIVATARDPQVDTFDFLQFLNSAPVKNAFKSAGLEPIEQ